MGNEGSIGNTRSTLRPAEASTKRFNCLQEEVCRLKLTEVF